ncbi:MAG TPA: hypothetical protein VMV10_02485 [Pirellulales bacterium]|nr:hypothetical protein [Pirellulales bacterium]
MPGNDLLTAPKTAPSPDEPVKSLECSRPRDPAMRLLYSNAALSQIPRLLGAIDRNPYRPTYGCFDREFWHYRTSSFPSEMYQEGVLPLALVYARELPGNRWHKSERVRELAIATLEFSARSAHADGSCDDYYPFERALGAAVFSLQAGARAHQLLQIDSSQILAGLERRAQWVMNHDESGRLANHHALAALGLARVAEITGQNVFRQAAERSLRRVLGWQSSEGWFEEYGGADPGYQTVTIDCLAQLRRMWNDDSLAEPLERAVRFARLFLHPDDSYGGEYGSRGTYHFYPRGFELLAGESAAAAELADGFLRSLAAGQQAAFDDDRMYVHRLGNLIEAYLDWSPTGAATCQHVEPVGNALCGVPGTGERESNSLHAERHGERSLQRAECHAARSLQRVSEYDANKCIRLRDAGLFVRREAGAYTIVSTARGGVFKHFAPERPTVTDAGLIVQTSHGIAVSQSHDRRLRMETSSGPASGEVDASPDEESFSVSGPLHWVCFETVTPLKQAVLQLGMCVIGRWQRTLVRRLLQRRLITGRRACPIRLTRTFEFSAARLRVTDRIELLDPKLRVERMSFASDLQAAYVAASDVYQDAALLPWTDLAAYVVELNETRQTTIVREL